ncbi:MAG: PPC domain-containing protein [Pirellulales bacterium]
MVRQINAWGDRDPLSIDNPSDVDWFQFQITADGSENDFAQIAFNPAFGDLSLELYRDPSQPALQPSPWESGVNTVSPGGLAARDADGRPITYYLKIEGAALGPGAAKATNPAYTLMVDAPGAVDESANWRPNDLYESRLDIPDNDKAENAYRFGLSQGFRVIGNPTRPLSIHRSGDEDWFRFTIDQVAQPGDFDWYRFELTQRPVAGSTVAIGFNQVLGDLDLYLYDADGNPARDGNGNPLQAATANSLERIPLDGLTTGTYYVKVAGHRGATNPEYSLIVSAPSRLMGPDWSETQLRAQGQDPASGQVSLDVVAGVSA